jgi:hypothetical protein
VFLFIIPQERNPFQREHVFIFEKKRPPFRRMMVAMFMKPSGRSSYAGLLPTGRKKVELLIITQGIIPFVYNAYS